MKILHKFKSIGDNFQDIALLLLRLFIAYEFFGPALHKINDISSTIADFTSYGIPLPKLNAYMAAGTEMAGVILLALGLLTRAISIPLLIILFVAFWFAHKGSANFDWDTAYSFQWPGIKFLVILALMLVLTFAFGAGKFSLDHFLKGKK